MASSAFVIIAKPLDWFKTAIYDPLDDRVDLLSTPICQLIVMCLLFVSFIGISVAPKIQCMTPPNYPGPWQKYAADYCYIQPHVYVRDSEHVEGDPERKVIAYFPWIPIFLCFQSWLFLFPKMFWDFCADHSDIDVPSIIRHANTLHHKSGDDRVNSIKQMVGHVVTSTKKRNKVSSTFFLFNSPTVMLYILKKWIYFLNAAAQFCLTVYFVGDGDYLWGIKAFRQSISGYGHLLHHVNGNDTTSPMFPLLTYCPVPRKVDNWNEMITVPCILSLNYLNEKIYIIIYFMMFLLSIISLFSAINATCFFFLPSRRLSWILSILKASRTSLDQFMAQTFINKYLHADGVLVLKIMHDSIGKAMAEETAKYLYMEIEMLEGVPPGLEEPLLERVVESSPPKTLRNRAPSRASSPPLLEPIAEMA